MKRVITVANHKGGVGKTTTVASLGVALSEMGNKVLLIDLDAQKNLTETLTAGTVSRTIYEALRDLQGLPVVPLSLSLDLCPSSLDLVAVDLELSSLPDREFRLRKLLQGLDYDYILIDCPPSLGLLTLNALTASNEVFIPLTAEALPARGLGTLLQIIDRTRESFNSSLQLSGIIITRYNRRKINKIVEESLRETFGEKVFRTRVRENVDLSEAPLYNKSIFDYSPRSIGAEDYRSLADEVEKMGRDNC